MRLWQAIIKTFGYKGESNCTHKGWNSQKKKKKKNCTHRNDEQIFYEEREREEI